MKILAYQYDQGAGSKVTSSPLPSVHHEELTPIHEPARGNDPNLVSFPFAFLVAMTSLVGFTVVIWGFLISNALMFFCGLIVTLIGLAIYGCSPGGESNLS